MKSRVRYLQIAGIVLVALSVCLLVFSYLYKGWASKEAAAVATEIHRILPQRTAGVAGEYADPQMPVLQYEKRDYVCLLDVPALGVSLPVQSTWEQDRLARNPCKYWGSCYDGTLILGGSRGQFDFCAKLDVGDRVVITDMRGAEFAYDVARIDRAGEASYEQLYDETYSLTLFVQESFSSDYIVVRCSLPG